MGGQRHQQAAVPVTDRELEAWSLIADSHAQHAALGKVNWVMIVRSLIAEIRRLRGGQ